MANKFSIESLILSDQTLTATGNNLFVNGTQVGLIDGLSTSGNVENTGSLIQSQINTVSTNLALTGSILNDRINNPVSGVAPSTNNLSIPIAIDVYGSTANLLGKPVAWQVITISGNQYKIPLY